MVGIKLSLVSQSLADSILTDAPSTFPIIWSLSHLIGIQITIHSKQQT